MEREFLFHMTGGEGERSYANNSSLQRTIMLKAKSMLEEAIRRLYSHSFPDCMKVADLGCSVGPNTLLVMSNIIDIVHAVCVGLNREPPTFQFYLNDLFGNDFNTIFKSLPDFYTKLVQDKGYKSGSCFINATPGSFHGRLFPSNSINLFHSANSVHWLSQDPFLGLSKEALNKGNCHIVSTSPPSVYTTFLKQFQKDFELFLKSRSEELVPGGAMVLVLLVRTETPRRSIYETISVTLSDMLLEGLIEEEKLESFNIPIYEAKVEEIVQVIREEGSFFIQESEIAIVPWDARKNEDGDENIGAAEFITSCIRAVTEPLLAANFGTKIMNELFIRFQKKIVQLMEVERLEYANLIIYLKKKLLIDVLE
ncbi:7-methylxanthosine synthase 1 [Vigna radiata var. radiata]|uniref:7-methylxanthosine synthase 1 n=1 Tax=Vigna radiata var. radiata TaxID=3916 RepID=A0A1S3TUH6_VIGRR|nr:7-methylxanthosine synthase 1 [Vigna radiata var. radiata]